MRGHARDPKGLLLYGAHRSLLLVDGVGRMELAHAHDPIPAAAHRPHGTPWPRRGDPFTETTRPLILTIGSDCAKLSTSVSNDLMSLARYPGVVLALMPGLDSRGFREAEAITWTDDGQNLSAKATPGADTDSPFGFFDGAAPAEMDRGRRDGFSFFPTDLVNLAEQTLGVPTAMARRLTIESAVHDALQHDYFVSPTLAHARHGEAMSWPDSAGVCTPDEAFRLAGVKARMYGSVPLLCGPDFVSSVNVGRLYDLATIHFVPGLVRALGGALGPDASAGEAAAADHILAIRARLNEILIARDAIYRLTRREALGPDWARPFDRRAVSGAIGNDLTANLAYHLSAALNSGFAATDNLAWVAAKRDNPQLKSREVGLTGLLGARQKGWRREATCNQLAGVLLGSRHLLFVLAARSLRNSVIHREGIDYGAIDWHPGHLAPIRGLSGLWLLRDTLLPVDLADGRSVDPFEILSHVANAWDHDLAVLTFQQVVERLWQDMAGLVSDGLGGLSWGSRDWARECLLDTGGVPSSRRQWRTRSQRRLWGI